MNFLKSKMYGNDWCLGIFNIYIMIIIKGKLKIKKLNLIYKKMKHFFK